MKQRNRKFWTGLIVAIGISSLIVGCSSTPTVLSTARAVPPERIYFHGEAKNAPFATVVFVKDEGLWASIGYHQVFLNGKLAASIKTGERLQFQLSPDDYIFRILPVAFTATKDAI